MAAPRRGGGVRAEGPEPHRKYLLEEQWRTKHQRAEPPVPVWEAGESQARTAPRPPARPPPAREAWRCCLWAPGREPEPSPPALSPQQQL